MRRSRAVLIGIDLGVSTTKAVGIDGQRVMGFISITSIDPISSAFGAIGKIIHELGIRLDEIDGLALTGVGSAKIPGDLLGIKTCKADEIKSIGYGGTHLTNKKRAMVVSIGTGTAIVAVDLEKGMIRHVGGTGIGGGTLAGLSKAMLNISELNTIENLAGRGDLSKVDLTVGELAGGPVGIIPEEVTASNFGKITDGTSREDLSLGLINMIAQTIGTLAYFTAKPYDLTEDIVFVGGLTKMDILKRFLITSTNIFGGKSTIPENAEYSTAIGAAIDLKRYGKS